MMPRKNASVATSNTSVTSPTSGPFSKFDFAAGARLKPISATIAPVTTGGSVTSIQ
jgi:multidrug resistance efflux pump